MGTHNTSIQNKIIDRFMAAGYDGFTAMSETKRIVQDFQKSKRQSMQFGIMGAHGKCVDALELKKKRGHL